MTNRKTLILGHTGMVGSAILRAFQAAGYTNILTPGRAELDLLRQESVERYFAAQKPEVVVLAAAKVGGILANNTYPAEFIYQNLMMQANVIHASYLNDAQRLVLLGSSCIYPKFAEQPIKESYLLTGTLEPTNEAYAIAKIAGLKMGEFYRRQYGLRTLSLMPCNLYGVNDNFHPEESHVFAALTRRFCDAATSGAGSVTVWGTGTPRREFLDADEVARALLALLDTYDDPTLLNVGSGVDVTIRELAECLAEKSGFRGRIVWDTLKPDGTPRKLMDVSRLHALGVRPRFDLAEACEKMVRVYREGLWFKGK